MAAVLGSIAPDASLFIMWGTAKFAGVPEAVIWREWYFADSWQYLSALTNSLPVFLMIAAIAFFAGGRWGSGWVRNSSMAAASTKIEQSVGHFWATLSLIFASAALLHVVTDFPLHHDDGRPHFWPFSDWIFRSPVSYWDPAHYGDLWSIFEIALAFVLLLVLWRRFNRTLVRSVLIVIGLSYVAMTAYWWLAFS